MIVKTKKAENKQQKTKAKAIIFLSNVLETTAKKKRTMLLIRETNGTVQIQKYELHHR